MTTADPEGTKLTSDREGTFRDYAWNYFAVHAQQRLQLFEFYITISTATLAGFFALLQVASARRLVCLVGFALTFFSFIFWKLELRTRTLVKNAEEALRYLDEQHGFPDIEGVPHPLRMFSRDDYFTSRAPKWPIATGHFSYSRSFKWVFRPWRGGRSRERHAGAGLHRLGWRQDARGGWLAR